MIIRRRETTLQLITQPDHAALAATIMAEWAPDHFPPSPRKPAILAAVAQHDDGWDDVDRSLVLDPTGTLVDFMHVPDAVKRETSMRGIERAGSDPYAAALIAQHRLHVYRRYAGEPAWDRFFAEVTMLRDHYLRAAEPLSLQQLLDDYALVRAGDLASLTFCNGWPDVDADGCGYAMSGDGAALFITPDPFAGRTIQVQIDAREIPAQPFSSDAAAREAVAKGPIVRLMGAVSGART